MSGGSCTHFLVIPSPAVAATLRRPPTATGKFHTDHGEVCYPGDRANVPSSGSSARKNLDSNSLCNCVVRHLPAGWKPCTLCNQQRCHQSPNRPRRAETPIRDFSAARTRRAISQRRPNTMKRRSSFANLTTKPKPRWDVHLPEVGGRAGSLAGGIRPLIAGPCGSGA